MFLKKREHYKIQYLYTEIKLTRPKCYNNNNRTEKKEVKYIQLYLNSERRHYVCLHCASDIFIIYRATNLYKFQINKIKCIYI